jgi:hypothetical protein
LREDAFDAYAQEINNQNRALGTAGSNKAARILIERRRAKFGLLGLVSGKAVLQRFFDWVQKECGVSLNTSTVVSSFDVATIPTEVKAVLTAIEHLRSFDSAWSGVSTSSEVTA